ncbi:MAG: nuclear transport factor 2 family protein [Nitrospirota bacterium]|nr:nuclear transport factor 2 family protein [Nitrospirota bacterium]
MDFTRTMQEIWQHHGKALAARDINEFIKDFADDCLFVNNPQGGHASGTFRGPLGVTEWCKEFFQLFKDISEFTYAETFTHDNTFVVLWEIHSTSHHVINGVDTFVIENGRFKIVTVVYYVVPRAKKG